MCLPGNLSTCFQPCPCQPPLVQPPPAVVQTCTPPSIRFVHARAHTHTHIHTHTHTLARTHTPPTRPPPPPPTTTTHRQHHHQHQPKHNDHHHHLDQNHPLSAGANDGNITLTANNAPRSLVIYDDRSTQPFLCCDLVPQGAANTDWAKKVTTTKGAMTCDGADEHAGHMAHGH